MPTPVEDTVEAEAEWYRTVVAGLPPLLDRDGGPFHLVDAYARRLSQGNRQLFVHRAGFTDTRETFERRSQRHTLQAVIRWPRLHDSLAHDEQAQLDEAVGAVLARIWGPTVANQTHGDRFATVPVDGVLVEYPAVTDILTAVDAAATGRAYTVTLTYEVDDRA